MKPIIVYDGICKLCNRSLRFILNRDSNDQFYYVPFQSEQGKLICEIYKVDTVKMDSFLFVEDKKVLTKSDAWSAIFLKLSFPYKVLGFVLVIIPKLMRNAVYDYIGSYRYKWFGKYDTCPIIVPDKLNIIPDIKELNEYFNVNRSE